MNQEILGNNEVKDFRMDVSFSCMIMSCLVETVVANGPTCRCR